jgi:prepilin-type N-terminal cleavage/methylation domain-containing protein/prepilin-type processing-associated H-X9-DG protein
MEREGVRRSHRRVGLLNAKRRSKRSGPCGFTLTELLVVIGLIAVLISLLLPVLGRVRASANAAACLSNLRQMNTAWTMYLTESRGRFPDYISSTPLQPNVAYRGYWLGVLDAYRVRGEALLCPSASEPIPYAQFGQKGAGNVNYAWTGKHISGTSVIKLNPTTYRVGSYGYNRRLTAEGGYGADTKATRISQVKNLTEVPVFFDCSTFDSRPDLASVAIPVQPPNDLHGELPVGAPDHWRLMIARHGRAINIGFADGSARRVPLEEIYMMQWATVWEKIPLHLPPF